MIVIAITPNSRRMVSSEPILRSFAAGPVAQRADICPNSYGGVGLSRGGVRLLYEGVRLLLVLAMICRVYYA